MKLFFRCAALFLLISAPAIAQFKLNGKIKNYSGKQELKINIPVVFGFYQQNSTSIDIAKDGSFAITLPVAEVKFANLIFQRKFYTLLLTPGRSLNAQLNESDTTMLLLDGTALPENMVMQKIDLEEYPFFLAEEKKSGFSAYSFDQMKSKIVAPYFEQRDNKLHKVMASSISAKEKSLISQEIKSIAYNYLNDFARTQTINRPLVDSLIRYVFDESEPKPSIFPAGPQYFAFVDNYIRYLETKSLHVMKTQKIPSNQALPYIGISLDSAKNLEGKMSKPLWRANIAARNLPFPVVEEYSFQQIINAFHYKELKQIEQLSAIFASRFPNSLHLAEVQAKTSALKAILKANENNTAIQIIPGHEQLKSIYDIVKPYRGKVVYLDIWGTWCGPCKEELQYNPALKDKFKDKDVVFLYLDMDEDSKDAEWRDFIKVNGLAGVHLRRSRATIAPIWKELLVNATDKAEYYPQYFIFDKQGKLVVTKANRPSSKGALYAQIEAYLK